MEDCSEVKVTKQLLPKAKQPIIAVETLPLRYEDFKPWLSEGCTVMLEFGLTGRRLSQPVLIELKPDTPRRDFDLINYVATALAGLQPKFIPWLVESPALMRLAAHLRRHRTSSPGTLRQYANKLSRFCSWVGETPDKLVNQCFTDEGIVDQKAVKRLTRLLDEYAGELQARGLTPSTINTYMHAIRTLLRVNEVEVPRIPKPMKRVVYHDRAPRPEELLRMLEVADLRGKVIVSCLALGGFRTGTLARLKYYHVKDDLERNLVPLHVHVEADITKGKYRDYDTFLGWEAVEYLQLYLESRRLGSPCGKIPPETITDESPLISSLHSKTPKTVTVHQIYRVVHNLYLKAGLIKRGNPKRYVLRPHSIRKYFRTQLAAHGVPRDYVEYMMGHAISTYHDIRMKGIEHLRQVYSASGLSIKPRTKIDRVEMLKEIIRAWGMDPERILVKEALAEPHRIYATAIGREEERVRQLSQALKEMLRRELLNGGHS